jgi:hypothetical protein
MAPPVKYLSTAPPPISGWYRSGNTAVYKWYIPNDIDYRWCCDPCSKETWIGTAIGTAFLVPGIIFSNSSVANVLYAGAGISYGLTLLNKIVKIKLCPEESQPLLPQTR